MHCLSPTELKRPTNAVNSQILDSKTVLSAMTQLGGLQVILALTGLIRNKVAAVYLGTMGMGEWSQLQGVATTIFAVVQFGMIVGLSRNTAAVTSNESRQRQLSVANALTMSMAAVVICATLAFSFIPSGGRLLENLGISTPLKLLVLLFVAALAPIEGMRNNFLGFLQGLLDIRGIATKRAIAVILATIAAVPLVSIFGIAGACLQFCVTSVLLAVLLGHRCYKLGYRPLQCRWERATVISLGVLGGANLLVTFAYGLVDVLIRSQLIRFAGLSQTGIYQAAFLLSSQVTQIALGSIGVFSLASISKSKNPEAISQQLHTLYQVILPISAAGLGFLGLVERPVVQLLFSSQFASSPEFLPLLLIGNSLQAACWVAGGPLLACGQVRMWLVLQMIGATLRYVGVWALLPVLGTQAIPLAFVLGQAFDILASLILCSRRLKITTSGADLARIGASAVLPGVLALIGLQITPLTFCGGMALWSAGIVILAPGQSSRIAATASGIAVKVWTRNLRNTD